MTTAFRSFARETEVRAKINKFVPLNIKSDVVVADLNADVDWQEASSATSRRTPFFDRRHRWCNGKTFLRVWTRLLSVTYPPWLVRLSAIIDPVFRDRLHGHEKSGPSHQKGCKVWTWFTLLQEAYEDWQCSLHAPEETPAQIRGVGTHVRLGLSASSVITQQRLG